MKVTGESQNVEIAEARVGASGARTAIYFGGAARNVRISGGMIVGASVGIEAGPGLEDLELADVKFIGTEVALRGVSGAVIENFYHDTKATPAEQLALWNQHKRKLETGAEPEVEPILPPASARSQRRDGENRAARRKRQREERKHRR